MPPPAADTPELLRAALAGLEAASTKKDLANLARFGIAATRPYGVSMANLQKLAKRLGTNHALAAALWKTGRYEARMLAALVDDPARVTPAQMDRWCRGFDNWGICDTVCFKLFDRSPHAWSRVAPWCRRREEFIRRAGFALLACLASHDRASGDAVAMWGAGPAWYNLGIVFTALPSTWAGAALPAARPAGSRR